jgi:hypothetical protein
MGIVNRSCDVYFGQVDKGDSIGIQWTIVEDDYVRLGLFMLNSN